MEDVFVEMMRWTVVAEVETEDVAAAFEQMTAERQHIQRVGAAFPAVQQHHEILCRRMTCGLAARVVTEEPYAFAAIENLIARNGEQVTGTSQEQRPPDAQARQDRLQVRIREPAWRVEAVRVRRSG